MVTAVDTDGDGFINIEEFGVLLDDGESDALCMAFEEYYENGDGMITAEELCRALYNFSRIPNDIDPKKEVKDPVIELMRVFKSFDTDADNRI
ncbi:hypothetical protein QYE76_055045 [Lolium multiflorum]|uniref:EF-hand domain-containing protein n=1 Tax=Lolium multiflorum TaxID=4521 RepID=A0AAD8SYX2_LOLMU|nr:hypothetical protein QYE76_055045 [Lolium multiflorum]